MLNIISKSLVEGGVNGPQKVVSNLIEGLDILGYPYCINKALDSTSQLWIHDDTTALKEASQKKLRAIVGPNLYILPRNIPQDLDLSYFIYLQPSRWVIDFWKNFGFNRCTQDAWPAGINTIDYTPSNDTKDEVLVYFKQRYASELEQVEKALREKKLKYTLISYGSYSESDYKSALKRSKYVIWLGRHESQGIALEEALATNTPILLCEIKFLGQWTPTQKESLLFTKEENEYSKVTVAPYFSDECGIKVYDTAKIAESIDLMEKNYSHFSPRKYILENLSMEKQAEELLRLYEKHFQISFDDGKKETPRNQNNWVNNTPSYIMYSKTKGLVKSLIRKIKKIWKTL